MASKPPPVNCTRCGEPYSSYGHKCWSAKDTLDATACSHPPAPARFNMGDGRRFHWRRCDRNGHEEYEVYSLGLETWAICYLPEEAAAVADGLELLYANDKIQP